MARKFLDGEAFKSLEDVQHGLAEPGVAVFLEEGDRQLVLLALAMLSIQRPGFTWALEQIALKMDNVLEPAIDSPPGPKPQMFTRLRELNIDREDPRG